MCTCTSIPGESSYRSLPLWHTPYGLSISFTCNPGAFETAASVMGLRLSDVMCLPLKVESQFPISFWVSQNLALLIFKARDYGGLSSQGRCPGQGVLDVGLDPLIPQGGSLYL